MTSTRAALVVFLASGLAACLAACKSTNSLSHEKFAARANAGTFSMLKYIDGNNGALAICLGFPDMDAVHAASAAAVVEPLIARAVNDWNVQLSDDPAWRIKQELQLTFQVSTSRCVPTPGTLVLSIWQDKVRFVAEACPGATIGQCSGETLMEQGEIKLGPLNRGLPADVYDYFRYLHEYGHILGLADTYKIPALRDWPGTQPPSIMNGLAVPRTQLTQDDKLGVWVLWRYVSTGVWSCDDGTIPVTMTANHWHELMCTPGALPVLPANVWATDAAPGTSADSPVSGHYASASQDGLSSYVDLELSSDAVGLTSVSIRLYDQGAALYQYPSVLRCDYDTVCFFAADNRFKLSLASSQAVYYYDPDHPNGVLLTLGAPNSPAASQPPGALTQPPPL